MEARRGGEGGRLGKYALLTSVVQYIADFITDSFFSKQF